MIDILALMGFLLSLYPALTGYRLHEWLGLVVGLVLLVHLGQHWHWVRTMSGIMDRIKTDTRIKYLVDVMLAAGFITIIVSGLVISALLNLTLAHYDLWGIVHVVASYVTLALMIWKIGLHWRLITGTIEKALSISGEPPRMTPEQLSRRKFLQNAGFTGLGLAVLVSKVNAYQKSFKDMSTDDRSTNPTESGQSLAQIPTTTLENNQGIVTNTPEVQSMIIQATPMATVTATPVAQTGNVICRYNCSYPGRCRKYQDNNQNGLCDLGEAIW